MGIYRGISIAGKSKEECLKEMEQIAKKFFVRSVRELVGKAEEEMSINDHNGQATPKVPGLTEIVRGILIHPDENCYYRGKAPVEVNGAFINIVSARFRSAGFGFEVWDIASEGLDLRISAGYEKMKSLMAARVRKVEQGRY